MKTELIALILLMAASTTVGAASSPEVWVLVEDPPGFVVVDTALETTSGPFSLPGQDPPFRIAFSKVIGFVGDFAFVTQADQLHVVDSGTRLVVDSFDIATLLGRDVVMRGAATTAPRPYMDPMQPLPQLRSHLLIAADVGALGGGPPFEPWLLVIDQEVAIGVAGRPLFVDTVPLFPGGDGFGREAMEVEPVDFPSGDKFQRGWVTVRDPSSSTLFAVEMSTDRSLDPADDYAVGEVQTFNLPAASSVPLYLRASTAVGRELTILTEGANDVLIELLNAGCCPLAGEAGAVSTTGPGQNSYTAHTFELGTGPAGENLLVQMRAEDCSVETFPVGEQPVDILTLGKVHWRKTYVLNRGSNTITVVRDDGTNGTIPLPPPPPPGPTATCSGCPLSFTGSMTSELGCGPRASVAISVSTADPADNEVNWSGVGCASGTLWDILCFCHDKDPANCPPDCNATFWPQTGNDGELPPKPLDRYPVDKTTEWEELCTGVNGTSYLHENANNFSGMLEYQVHPSD